MSTKRQTIPEEQWKELKDQEGYYDITPVIRPGIVCMKTRYVVPSEYEDGLYRHITHLKDVRGYPGKRWWKFWMWGKRSVEDATREARRLCAQHSIEQEEEREAVEEILREVNEARAQWSWSNDIRSTAS